MRSLTMVCRIRDNNNICVYQQNANSTLTRLDLEGNSIGAAGAAAVAAAIEREDSGLRHLNLSWNNLSTDGAQSIAGALDVSAQ